MNFTVTVHVVTSLTIKKWCVALYRVFCRCAPSLVVNLIKEKLCRGEKSKSDHSVKWKENLIFRLFFFNNSGYLGEIKFISSTPTQTGLISSNN